MWTSTLELSPKRVILTQLLGRLWHGAYFSSFAPLQVQNLLDNHYLQQIGCAYAIAWRAYVEATCI